MTTVPHSYMAKVENVLSEWEAHGIDAAQARKRFREVVQEWLASPYGPVEQDRKDAERYRVWRRVGVEYVWNARIREFAGDDLDELTDKLIADRAFDPDYYDLT
jgi:hypothetical protein